MTSRSAAESRKTILLFNYRARAARPGYGEDDAAMALAPHALRAYLAHHGPRGVQAQVMISGQGEPQETTLKTIYSIAPDIIGFGCYVWNFSATLALAGKIRLVLPGTEIILGGPEVGDPDYAREIMMLNPFVDAVIQGEGEEPLSLYLDPATPRRAIPGLCYRDKGRIITNPGFPCLPDPSAAPSFYTPEFLRGFPVVYYATSRGCVGKCKYCREWSAKRNLPLERIERDLKIIFASKDIKQLGFIDSVLDDNSERLRELLKIAARLNRNKIPISGYFYFQRPAPDLFDLLERAHFKYLRVGIESRNPDTLRLVGRGKRNLSHIENAIAHKNKFTIVPYIISHLPGETPASFKENIIKCFRAGLLLLDFHCNRLDIFPGTPLYKSAARDGYTFDNRPPHHVFTSKNWSYTQFIQDRFFLRNIMILGRIFTPEDEAFLSHNGIDLFDMAEHIHEISPMWKTAFTALSPDTISDIAINENLIQAFAGYAGKSIRAKTARDVVMRLFEFGRAAMIASHIRETHPDSVPHSGDITPASAVFLPFFHRLEPGPSILFAKRNPATPINKLPRDENGLFVLGRCSRNQAYNFSTSDSAAAEKFFLALAGNRHSRRPLSTLLGDFAPADRERFMALIFYLKENDSLFFCDLNND